MPLDCRAGYYCMSPAEELMCTTPGAFCEQGSTDESLCEAGSYCMTATRTALCPQGSCHVVYM